MKFHDNDIAEFVFYSAIENGVESLLEQLPYELAEKIREHIEDNLTIEDVESYAEEQNHYFGENMIDSERCLSRRFDEMLEELGGSFDYDDTVALNEWFNNWSDALCKDGELHQLQYDQYTYVGQYA